MKPLDLESAVKGEPVVLRNGSKAYVLADLRDLFSSNISIRCLVGVSSTKDYSGVYSGKMTWRYDGTYYDRLGESDYDIVGMWEEPKLTTEELMEKAFQEKLVVTRTKLPLCGGFEVVGKTLDGDYILQNCDNAELRFLREFSEDIEWSIME